MARVLYLEASPRKSRSASIAVTSAFLSAYADKNPNDTIEKIDLWDTELPAFDGDMLDAKYAVMHSEDFTADQQQAWNSVTKIAKRFSSADKFVISTPMWNFSIPYQLKHYIDIVTQPGLTFSFSPDTGYTGLVTDKPVTVVYARGGSYPMGSEAAAYDMQKPYVELWLQFIGFTDLRSIVVEPTLGDPETVSRAKSQAIEDAERAAVVF